jgi:hypothetical protein
MLMYVFFLCSAFILDSTLYSVDIERGVIDEIEFPDAIIDYVADDFMYIFTNDCLYKIDPGRALIVDWTPLPLRFNYVLLRKDEIILISTDEIIVLDRKNLAFKSGIGIERGDHRPIIKDQSLIGLPGQHTIFLLSDFCTRNTMRAVDLSSGRTTARVTVKSIKDVIYDHQDSSFIALEQGQNLTILDHQMKIQRRVNLSFETLSLVNQEKSLCIFSDHGIFHLTKKGELIDFQPLPGLRNVCNTTLLTDEGIFWFDSLTFRISEWLQNHNHINRLQADAGSGRIIGMDIHDEMYLVEHSPGYVSKLTHHRRDLVQSLPASPRADSLWYLQLGAFSDPSNAGQMYEEFRNKRIPVFVDTADLYRIKFGGFTGKPMALDLQEKMDLNGWLVFEPRIYRDTSEIFYIGVERYVINKGIVGKE